MSLISDLRKPFTRAGKVYFTVAAACVIGVSLIVYLYPDGWLARTVASGPFVVVVLVLAGILELCLSILGIKLVREEPPESASNSTQKVTEVQAGVAESTSAASMPAGTGNWSEPGVPKTGGRIFRIRRIGLAIASVLMLLLAAYLAISLDKFDSGGFDTSDNPALGGAAAACGLALILGLVGLFQSFRDK